MLNLETLSILLDEFGGAPVLVQGEHCLNTRHKDAGCRRCVDACPTDAVELQAAGTSPGAGPQQPHLDPKRCVNCGLCLHWCPTDVFMQRSAPEAGLVQTAAMLPDEVLGLVCSQHNNPEDTPAPVSTVVRHKRCLASLSVSHLLELSDGGRRTLWLDDSVCADCPIGRVQPAIVQTVEAANQLLQAFGRPPAIYTSVGHPDRLENGSTPRRVIDGDRPELSRRGFFGALRQMGRRTAATLIAEGTATLLSSDLSPEHTGRLVPVEQRLPHRIPASRDRLFRQLKRLGAPAEQIVETAGIPFADVAVDGSACSACGLCARFCPTGALSFATDEERFALYFRPVLCIDCGICAVACPEDAIRFGTRLPAAALVEVEPKLLVAGELTACVECGVPTAVLEEEAGQSGDGPRCYVCRQGAGPMSPLQDTARLIADLSERLSEAV